MSLLKNDSEGKQVLVDMLDNATFGHAEALTMALDKWEELEQLKGKRFTEKLRDVELSDLGSSFVWGHDRRRVCLMAIRVDGIEFIDCLSNKTYIAQFYGVDGDQLIVGGTHEKM